MQGFLVGVLGLKGLWDFLREEGRQSSYWLLDLASLGRMCEEPLARERAMPRRAWTRSQPVLGGML